MSRRWLLLGFGVAVGEAAALALAAKRWFRPSPAPAASSLREPPLDEAVSDTPPAAAPPFDVPAPEAPTSETAPPAPSFVERRVGERRAAENRRKRRADVVERIAGATERRSDGERRTGADRRHSAPASV